MFSQSPFALFIRSVIGWKAAAGPNGVRAEIFFAPMMSSAHLFLWREGGHTTPDCNALSQALCMLVMSHVSFCFEVDGT